MYTYKNKEQETVEILTVKEFKARVNAGACLAHFGLDLDQQNSKNYVIWLGGRKYYASKNFDIKLPAGVMITDSKKYGKNFIRFFNPKKHEEVLQERLGTDWVPEGFEVLMTL